MINDQRKSWDRVCFIEVAIQNFVKFFKTSTLLKTGKELFVFLYRMNITGLKKILMREFFVHVGLFFAHTFWLAF